MSQLELTQRNHLSHGETDGWHDSDRVFFESLIDLVAKIEESSHDVSYTCWADDEYEYMEMTLPEGLDLDLDLNIHGPRVFIRSVRNDG